MPSREANYIDRQAGTQQRRHRWQQERKKIEWREQGEEGDYPYYYYHFIQPRRKDMFGKLSFRWLNIQIAPLPLAPWLPPSSWLWLSILEMRSCCTHPASGERPHSPLLNLDAVSWRPAFDVLIIWRTQGYQLAVNSVTTLHHSQGQQSQLSQHGRPAASSSAADGPD